MALRHARCASVQQQVMDAWSTFASESAAMNKKLTYMMAKWRSKELVDYFWCWVTFVSLTKQMRLMVTQAEHFLRPRMLRFLWDTFVAGVYRVRDTRKLVLIAMTHDTNHQLMRTVIIWQEWLDRKLRRKDLQRIANSFFLRREFKRWEEWTQNKISYEVKVSNAIRYWCGDLKKKSMIAWRNVVTAQQHLRATMRKVFERHVNRVERDAFSRWRNLLYAARLYECLAQKRAVKGWQDVLDKECKIRMVLGKIMHATLARYFGSWRLKVVQSSGVYSLRLTVYRRVKYQLFHLWRVRRLKQIALRIFASRIVLRALAQYWQSFQEGVQHQVEAELALQKTVCKSISDAWYKCYLMNLMVRWGHYAHISNICQQLQLVSADKILREIMGAWHAHTAKQVHLRRIAAQIIYKIQNTCTAAALQSWQNFTARSVRVKTFAIGILTSTIQSRFERWSRYTSVCVRRKSLVAATVARRRVVTLTAHLHKWSAVTKLLLQVACFIGNRHEVSAQRAFSWWAMEVDQKIEMRTSIALMQSEIKLRPVCSSVALECAYRWTTLDLEVPFAHWKRVWHIKQMRRKASKIGLMNHFAGYKRRCYDTWVFSTQLHKKGMACMAKMRDKDKKTAFDMWCDVVEYDKLLRIKLRDAMVHQEIFLHRISFTLWRRQVRISQGVLFMLHHRAYRYVTQAFAEWSIRTVVWVNESHKTLKARCHWALALLFGTFSSWAEGVAAIKMAKHFLNLHKLHLASVRLDQHLRAWQMTASRRNYLRTAALWMWARNYQARYLTGWLLVVASTIAMKRKVVLAATNVRRRYFSKWRQVAKRRAGIYNVTNTWWVAFSLRKLFSEWKRDVGLRKMWVVVNQQFCTARHPQILRAHLRHWRLSVVGELKFRQIMDKFAPVRNLHGLLAHFQAWWQMTGILQRDRLVQAEVEALHAEFVQFQSLQRWRRQYTLKLGFRRHKYEHFCLKVLVAWHMEAHRSARQKAMVYRLLNGVTYSAFLQWRACVVERKRMRELAQKFMNRLLGQSKLKGFSQWCDYTMHTIYMAQCKTKANAKWVHSTKRKVFSRLVQHVAKKRHSYDQIDKAVGHFNKKWLNNVAREFFVTAAHFVRVQRFVVKLMRKQHFEIYSTVWVPLQANWKKGRWVKSCLQKFRPVILRRCISSWLLGNVINKLEFVRDDKDKELNAEIRALLAEGDRKAARTLAIHRNLITRWQMKYYSWVFEIFGERMRKVLGCRRVMWRMQNLACETAFHRWKGLIIAIYRGRELKAWRDTGRIVEGFQAWQWLHGKIKAVNAGVVRRALHGWHQRVVAESLYQDGLLGLCGKEGSVLHKNVAIHSRMMRRTIRAWSQAGHRAAKLAKAHLNGLRVLSGYRYFIIWMQFLENRQANRATSRMYEKHHDRALLLKTFTVWRMLRASLYGDKILMKCFLRDSNFLRKRMATERWLLYVANKHRIFRYRATVLRHRRLHQLETRAAITRERSLLFWKNRNAAYEQWKHGRKTSMPAMWDNGLAESPRHVISSMSSDKHPLEVSPKKLFQDRELESQSQHSPSQRQLEVDTEPIIARQRSGRSRSQTTATSSPSVFESDRSSLTVPRVSEVSWIQKEFEKDIRLYKQKQEDDLSHTVSSMKRADLLLVVDMYIKGVSERQVLVPFIAWKDLVRVFSLRAHESLRYELRSFIGNWSTEAFDEHGDSEHNALKCLRSAYTFWQVKATQGAIRRRAAPHQARMMSSVEAKFLNGGTRTSALTVCLRAWRKMLAHSTRVLPVLEEKAVRFYRRVGRRAALRDAWVTWQQLHFRCRLVRHAQLNLGGINLRVVFEGWCSYVLICRQKAERQDWAAKRRGLHLLRAAFIVLRVYQQGRGVVSAKPLGHNGLEHVLQDDTRHRDTLGDPLGVSLKPLELDDEHDTFVRTAAKAGKRMTALVD
jgi:hypothetical protein